MTFTHGLLFTLCSVIVVSALGVDGKRTKYPYPLDNIPHVFPDAPEDPRRELPDESANAIPAEDPVKVPVEVINFPEQDVGSKTSETDGDCRMNICFALDGSNSISSSEYQRQRFLARLIAEGLPAGEDFGLAAVQYSVASTQISPLTFDRTDFIQSVRASRQDGGPSGTFVVAGINFCFSEFFEPNMTEPLCGINKIVLMGDGRGNIGADPVARAREFEAQGGQVCTVGFGSPEEGVLEAIAGDMSRAFVAEGSIRRLAGTILESILGRR